MSSNLTITPRALATTLLLAGVVSSILTKHYISRKSHSKYLANLQKQREQKQADQATSEAKRTAHNEKAQETGEQKVPSGTKIPNASISGVYLWEVENLSDRFAPQGAGVNVMKNQCGVKYSEYTEDKEKPSELETQIIEGSSANSSYNKLIASQECILADIQFKPSKNATPYSRAYVRAGPRSKLHFKPAQVTAAVVTCGGMCPGLNNVIRELTNTLHYLYGAKKVLGVRGGYGGFYNTGKEWDPVVLTPELVQNVHHEGGTFLGSSRGGFDLEKIMEFLLKHDVNMLFIIGGDGTHRGAFKVHEECVSRSLNIAVAGIPKTIDNDIDHIDRSFGFNSAVEAAQLAIRTAKTEAMCNLPNGIGVVKVMGRSAGFIAVHATMGSGDVDLCLVPEVPIVLEGPNGCLPFLYKRVKEQGYAVVVVAEGAGEELLGENLETDKSGNKVLPAIGAYLKSKIEGFFSKKSDPATVKYIDPSYMIRSVPANAADSLYCMQLAQNAIHGAMAGYTGFSVGLCNNRMVLLPIPELVKTSPRMMDAHGRTWERILAITRQPNTAPPKKEGEKSHYAPMLR
jgi:6-phosphofructokinase 1